jgi:ZIP family zinc transporter
MPLTQTVILGAIAGLTIYIGLPVGRMRLLGTRARVGLAMFAVGVLAFIFFDVLSGAHAIIGHALDQLRAGTGSPVYVVTLVAVLGAGFAAGSAGLAVLERTLRAPARPRLRFPGGGRLVAVAAGSGDEVVVAADSTRVQSLRTGLMIASAIGVHNFAEGLAIGVSARSGAISLATVLIIGFALHNATEGFGIVGPLGDVVPTWRWLGVAGLIAGGPTFLGAIVGHTITSQPLELAAYAIAAGAILYVIGEVWNAMRRHGYREFGLLMLTGGFLAGVLTDLVVSYGGA